MADTNCKKCGHLCHCIEADHEGCDCTGCDCGNNQKLDSTNKGLVIDDTEECEACQ
jgi:hypothetical protein